MLRRGGHDVIEAQKEGIETILNLRRENPTLPILAISGVPGRSKLFLDMAQRLGANGTLAKPFRAADLLREINKLLLR
jgi:CheY-like chemotaxis protein